MLPLRLIAPVLLIERFLPEERIKLGTIVLSVEAVLKPPKVSEPDSMMPPGVRLSPAISVLRVTLPFAVPPLAIVIGPAPREYPVMFTVLPLPVIVPRFIFQGPKMVKFWPLKLMLLPFALNDAEQEQPAPFKKERL